MLAFTDADCAPTPEWLRFGLDALAGAELVQGSVVPQPGVPRGPFDKTIWVTAESPRLFETANLFVRAATFDAVGGFRAFTMASANGLPGLRPTAPTEHFGEDIVFACTAISRGARFSFEPRAVVHHAVFPRNARAYVRERWRLRYMPALLREAPELRRSFWRPPFLSERTARFDLALLGLLLTAVTGRRASLVLLAPYLRRLRRHGLWRRSAWRENAGVVAADAVGFAALAHGSFVARTLLL